MKKRISASFIGRSLLGVSLALGIIVGLGACEKVDVKVNPQAKVIKDLPTADFVVGVDELRCDRHFYAVVDGDEGKVRKLMQEEWMDGCSVFSDYEFLNQEPDYGTNERVFRKTNEPWMMHRLQPTQPVWFAGDSVTVTAWNDIWIEAYPKDKEDEGFKGVNVVSSNTGVVYVQRDSTFGAETASRRFLLKYAADGECDLRISAGKTERTIHIYARERIPLQGIKILFRGKTRIITPAEKDTYQCELRFSTSLDDGEELDILDIAPHNCSWRLLGMCKPGDIYFKSFLGCVFENDYHELKDVLVGTNSPATYYNTNGDVNQVCDRKILLCDYASIANIYGHLQTLSSDRIIFGLSIINQAKNKHAVQYGEAKTRTNEEMFFRYSLRE